MEAIYLAKRSLPAYQATRYHNSVAFSMNSKFTY